LGGTFEESLFMGYLRYGARDEEHVDQQASG
jgi:hypothetical protein